MPSSIMFTNIALSLLTVFAAAAVSPAIAVLAQAFPDVDPMYVRMILTLPSLTMIPASLLAEKVSNYFGRRNALLLSLVIYIISGVAPMFAESIGQILVCRLFLGVSVGFLMPMTSALIPEYSPPEHHMRLMGISTASCNLGGVLTSIAAGLLLTLSWRATFSVYFMALLALVCVWLYIPKREKHFEAVRSDKIPFTVFKIALIICLAQIGYYVVVTDISFFLKENNIGWLGFSGVVLGTLNLAAFFGSLLSSILVKFFKIFLLPVSIIVEALGVFLLINSADIYSVLASVGILGFCAGILIPFCFMQVAKIASDNQYVKSMGVVSSSMYLGYFLSPIIIHGIASYFNAFSSSDVLFVTVYWFIVLSCLLLIDTFITIARERKRL